MMIESTSAPTQYIFEHMLKFTCVYEESYEEIMEQLNVEEERRVKVRGMFKDGKPKIKIFEKILD